MRIVALGGGGYIGSYLVHRLADQGHTIWVLDTNMDKIWEHDKDVPTTVDLDVRDLRAMSEAELTEYCRGADVVIDLIAHATPALYVKSPIEVVELNYNENMRVVRVCAALDIRLIQFSSCEVYGLALDEEPFKEDKSPMVLGPVHETRWIYASAKQLLERMVDAYGIHRNLDYTVIRPFNFVGPFMDYLRGAEHDPVPRVFPQFIASLVHGFPMTLVNGGHSHRTFTYIDDAIDACMLVIENRNNLFGHRAVNVGTPGNGILIRDLANRMRMVYASLTGRPQVDIIEGDGVGFYGDGYVDCNRRVPDVARLEEAGWAPQYDLNATIRKTLSYYAQT